MQIGLTLFATDLSIPPAELAVAAEERGFASLYVPEHTHIPVSRETPPPTAGDDLDDKNLRTPDPLGSLGAAAGIDRFYRDIFGAISSLTEHKGATTAQVHAGERQNLYFRETETPRVPYDNNHIQFYINDFSGPYEKLLERGLIYQESNQHQYRFKDIVDPESGEVVYTLLGVTLLGFGHELNRRAFW